MKTTFSLVIVTAAFIWIYAKPYMVARDIYYSATVDNKHNMAEILDLPVLQANLKPQIESELMDQYQIDIPHNQKEVSDMVWVSLATGNIVNRLTTPSGLMKIISGEVIPDHNDITRSISEQFMDTGHMKQQAKSHWNKAFYQYFSLNRFDVLVPTEQGGVTFILTRSGISWKLTNIIFSRDRITPMKRTT